MFYIFHIYYKLRADMVPCAASSSVHVSTVCHLVHDRFGGAGYAPRSMAMQRADADHCSTLYVTHMSPLLGKQEQTLSTMLPPLSLVFRAPLTRGLSPPVLYCRLCASLFQYFPSVSYSPALSLSFSLDLVQ